MVSDKILSMAKIYRSQIDIFTTSLAISSAQFVNALEHLAMTLVWMK